MSDPNLTLYAYLDQTDGLGYDQASAKDFSIQVMAVSTRRGRNRLLNSYEAGEAIITIKDDNGYFNPQNTSSPYYPVRPMNKVRLAIFNSDQPIFTGYVTSMRTEFARGQEDYNKVILVCNDLLRYLNQIQITTVTGAGSVQKSGVRIGKLLDMAGYPATPRSIATGDFDMQADPGTSRNLLDAIRTVQDSENGAFFINDHGVPSFYSQTGVGTNATSDSWRFNDTDETYGGLFSAIGFTDAKVNFDDGILFNNITVTRTGGSPQTASSPTSIALYGQRNATRDNTLNVSDSDALVIAKNLRNTLQYADIRIDQILVPYMGKTSLMQSALRSVDLYFPREAWKIMADSSTIKKKYVITGIQWEITKQSFWVRYLLQEPLVRLFVLNSTTLGTLDYNGLG